MKFNVEDAFITAGNKHLYQKIALFSILFIWFSIDFVSLIFPLFELEPKYECKINDEFTKCEKNIACDLSPERVNRIIEYRNILTDYNIDCNKVELIFVGVSYTMGILLGSFLASIFSDIFGRKPVLLISEIIFFLSATLLINSPNYIFIVISLFFCGVACSGGTIISFLYINEVLCKEKRSIYGVSISVFFALAGLLYFFCFQHIKNWIYLTNISMGLDLISFFLILFYFVESPRFFYSRNKYSKSLRALYSISIINNKKREFEYFIKKNYIFFLQGKNKDFYFDEFGIKSININHRNPKESYYSKDNSSYNTIDEIVHENNKCQKDKNETKEKNDTTTKNKDLVVSIFEINKYNIDEYIILEELNLEEIFIFLEDYEKEFLNLLDYENTSKKEERNNSRNKIYKKYEDNTQFKNLVNKEYSKSVNDRTVLSYIGNKKETLLDNEHRNKIRNNISITKNNDMENDANFTKEEFYSFNNIPENDILVNINSTNMTIGEIINNNKLLEKKKLLSLENIQTDKNLNRELSLKLKKDCNSSSYFSLLRYKSIRYKFLICNLIWFTYAFSYYGISFYIKNGKDEVFEDGYIVYSAEIISLIISFFIMSSSYFGRVRTINIMMIISGFSTLSFYLMKKYNIEYYDKIPLFLSRFSITGINSTMYTYSTEFYPTIIRAKGLGINIFFARIACCFVPIVIDLIDNPFLIFSILCFFTSIFTFFLSETLNKELEDEISE